MTLVWRLIPLAFADESLVLELLVIVVLAWLLVDLRDIDLREATLEAGPLILVLKLVHSSMCMTVLVVLVFRCANLAMVLLLFSLSILDCSTMTYCPLMACLMTLSMLDLSTVLFAGQVAGCVSLLMSIRTPCSCPLAGASCP